MDYLVMIGAICVVCVGIGEFIWYKTIKNMWETY